MHIAVGYNWFETAAGHHIERALRELGHIVTYVGLGSAARSGYPGAASIVSICERLPRLPQLFLWIDPAGPYMPLDIEKLPIPTACYLIDVHLGSWRTSVARFFDVVFVAQKDYVTHFRHALGHSQVYWLPLAAATDVHRRLDLDRTYDVGFIGNITLAHRSTARVRRLKMVSTRFRTNDFYRSYTPFELSQVYSASKIVLNTSIAGDVTMRIFEGAACGAMVLTDGIANGLEELYSIGDELVTYSDDNDMLEKANHYLTHPEERASIADAGYCRTLKEHTYNHRMEKTLGILANTELARSAPMRQAREPERWQARHDILTHLHMLDALLTEARERGFGPLQRARAVLPCLARRLLL